MSVLLHPPQFRSCDIWWRASELHDLEPIARSLLNWLSQSRYLPGFFLVRLGFSRWACVAGFGLVEGGLGGELAVGGSWAALSLINFPAPSSLSLIHI